MTEHPVPGAAPENRDPSWRPVDPTPRPGPGEGVQPAAHEASPQDGDYRTAGGSENPTMRIDSGSNPTTPLERLTHNAEQQPRNTEQQRSGGPHPEYPQHAPFFGQQSGAAGQPPGPQHNPYSQHSSHSAFQDNRSQPKRKATFGVGTLVASILAKPRRALAIGKELFYRQREMGLEAAYQLAGQTMAANMMEPCALEGVTAFTEKRQPNWTK